MKRTILFTGVALALCLVVLTAWSQAAAANNGLLRTTFPSSEDPGPPFYARIEPNPPHVVTDGDWVGIYFHRDPSCVRADFNLLSFEIDFAGAFACSLKVSGAHYWEGEPHSLPPKIRISSGDGAVPVWFAPVSAFQASIQDGVLTIGELAGLEGLMVGYADHFNEVLHPAIIPALGGGGHPNRKLIVNAQGQLEDGRTFILHETVVKGEIKVVSIDFR